MSIQRSLLTVILFDSSDIRTAQQTVSVRLINRSIGFVKQTALVRCLEKDSLIICASTRAAKGTVNDVSRVLEAEHRTSFSVVGFSPSKK